MVVQGRYLIYRDFIPTPDESEVHFNRRVTEFIVSREANNSFYSIETLPLPALKDEDGVTVYPLRFNVLMGATDYGTSGVMFDLIEKHGFIYIEW